MHFIAPAPSPSELDAYNAAYFENAHHGDADSGAARAFHSGVNRIRVEHVEKVRRMEGIAIRRVLEVGPGRGEFASHWRSIHPDTDYHAIEADLSCHEFLRHAGVSVHRSVSELEGADAGFDLLVMSHVLEHTRDPVSFLASMLNHLRAGALVFIEVPCRDDEHKPADEPHLLFFDRRPMERLFNRCGVKPVRISYHGIELERLRAGWATQPTLARRVIERVRQVADKIGLLAARGDLALIKDPEARASVRRLEADVEKSTPAWWLRAVGQTHAIANTR
jgi:SAM-dependent methyltransferase